VNGSGLARQIARLAVVGATCVALYGIPAQAQTITISINVSNWFQGHSTWSQHCNAQPQNGHWGRAVQYNQWCYQNLRFRDTQPDTQWRHDHAWDHGLPQDYAPSNAGNQPINHDDGNSK